jgi:hypothetical protein
MAAARKSSAVLAASIVVGDRDMTAAVPRLIRVEMSERLRATFRKRSVIPMVRVPAVIHMANKTGRAVKPWAGADEYSVDEPIWPIIAIERAVVWRVVKVPIRTDRAQAQCSRRR